ncbi:MAG: response regulator [Candidatus Omnitrophica bacterium]|nr:response regulator [Candidatus Omnitrophota bacterium]
MGAPLEKKTKRILVVDDDGLSQELMAIVLDALGYSYESAKNGKEAVEKALKQDFDLVLMDLRMPVMNGYDAARKIHEVKENLPIYALTAHVLDYVPSKCRDAGMTGIFPKPIDVPKFNEWLKTRMGMEFGAP